MGQAAYLMQNQNNVYGVFFKSIPNPVNWPVFIIATAAAIIASQAAITATFTIIKQSVALGCFPRVKVVHTSTDFSGQIYIVEINWILMIFCIKVTVGFNNTTQIGNAYGTTDAAVLLAASYKSHHANYVAH